MTEFILGSVTRASCGSLHLPSGGRTERRSPTILASKRGGSSSASTAQKLSVDATRLAFEEASLRRSGLTLLHVWNAPGCHAAGVVVPDTFLLEDAHSDELRGMAETVAGLGEKYPDVHVERQLQEQGRPAKVLAESSRGAALVVVGSRGHGGFASLVLGSTSRSLLHHAECTVLVVKPGSVMT